MLIIVLKDRMMLERVIACMKATYKKAMTVFTSSPSLSYIPAHAGAAEGASQRGSA